MPLVLQEVTPQPKVSTAPLLANSKLKAEPHDSYNHAVGNTIQHGYMNHVAPPLDSYNHAVGNTIQAISHHEVRKRGKPLLITVCLPACLEISTNYVTHRVRPVYILFANNHT